MSGKKLIPDSLSSGGEMGECIRGFDWRTTSLGALETWSQSLLTTVGMMVNNRFPMLLWWSSDYISIYNDAYIPILGTKHPWALGKPVSECWSEIWDILRPLIDKPFHGGPATWMDDIQLIINRKGYNEETHFVIAYSPVPDQTVRGGIGGVLATVHEITEKVTNDRALSTLRDLGTVAFEEKSLDTIYRNVADVLGKNNKDFPFALVYKITGEENTVEVVASTGVDKKQNVFPDKIDITKPTAITKEFCQAFRENMIVVHEIEVESKTLPKGAWEASPNQFIHLPVSVAGANHPYCIISAALNPFRKFDETYRQFCQLISERVSLEINKMLALEEETKRAEALAEIDHAKTLFFTNISHEFRTPLTLMLSPLEELLNKKNLDDIEKNNIETSHRNALRLLKLVNTLLDFSRIELGRQQANFSLVDIISLTKNLASNFRSVIEKAGLKLEVIVDGVIEPVYIDKEMWEKIVFNLLSNAFKYTLEGKIIIELSSDKKFVLIKVSDTGVGIPEKELPHMFERFHRIQNIQGRSYEGTGIGLSLIKELVQFHGGEISVDSKVGKGTTFTVKIPFGKEHLSSNQFKNGGAVTEQISSTIYIDEVTTLLESVYEKNVDGGKSSYGSKPARNEIVMIVDDNADMRKHIQSLLAENFKTITATNGMDALHKIQKSKPALILSDIMMPVMDGTELLKEVKKNKNTAHIPVILLTARAGEESKIAGYQLGADDYLVKPFSSKELIARITAQINIASERRKIETSIRNVILQSPVAMCKFEGPNHVLQFANKKMGEILGRNIDDLLDKPIFETMPEGAEQGFKDLLDGVYTTGETFSAWEVPVVSSKNGKVEKFFINYVYEPYRETDGTITGVFAVVTEVTEQVLARKKLEESVIENSMLAAIVQSSEDAIVSKTLEGIVTSWNSGAQKLFGYTAEEMIGQSITKIIPEDRLTEEPDILNKIQHGEIVDHFQTKRIDKNGNLLDISLTISPIRNNEGKIIGASKIARNITAEKKAEEKLRESEKKFRELSATLEQKIAIRTFELRRQKEFIETILDTTPDLIGAYDSDMRIIAFNKACEDFFKIKREQIIGQIFTDVFLIAKGGQAEKDLQFALKGETIHNTVYHSPISGKYYENFLSPLKDETGNIYAAVVMAHDITETVLSTEKLKQSEEKFNKLFTASPLGLTLSEASSGKIIDVNNVYLETIGYTSDECIGKTSLELNLINKNDRQKILEELLKNGFVKNVEVEIKLKTGKKIPILNSIETIIVGGKKYFLSAVIDISERKRSEQEIKQANIELKKMNEELASFAYVSSHDLQEPLRKIQAFSTRILQQETESLSEKSLNYFSRIINASQRMQNLIDALLSYSRTNTGEKIFQPSDLNDVLKEVKENLYEQIEENNAVIDASELPVINIIPQQFQQLLNNIISNALKYRKEGVNPVIKIKSEKVSASEIKKHPSLSSNEYWKISITDNGIGFDPQYATKIFELFQRLHGRNEYSGTGIGLAICKKIVENHNGLIIAESKSGKGATFNIYIPDNNKL